MCGSVDFTLFRFLSEAPQFRSSEELNSSLNICGLVKVNQEKPIFCGVLGVHCQCVSEEALARPPRG